MPNAGDGGDVPRDTLQPDDETGKEEVVEVLRTGPKAGNRAGGLAFLAILAILVAALHYHLTGTGAESFPARLDSDLLTHAELTLASNEKGNRLAVVPVWPIRLYYVLRRDIAVYAVLAVFASFLWGWAVRARARREAFLVHEKLEAEIEELRRKLDEMEKKT